MGLSKSNSKREVYSDTIIPQEARKASSSSLTLHLKQPEKEEQKTHRVSRRKIIRIRAEINEKEVKQKIAKINITKSWFFEMINKIDKPLTRLRKRKKGGRKIKSIKL